MPNLSFEPLRSITLGPTDLHDIVAEPAEHFETTTDITVHIGQASEGTRRRIQCALTTEDTVISTSMIYLSEGVRDVSETKIPVSLISSNRTLAEHILRIIFKQNRASLNPYLQQISYEDFVKKLQGE